LEFRNPRDSIPRRFPEDLGSGVRMPNESDSSFAIHLNGERFIVDGDASVSSLVDRLKLSRRRVAVEINFSVVPKAQWDVVTLRPGDSVEIVNFVGGG
jgi:sulfur carrier protein